MRAHGPAGSSSSRRQCWQTALGLTPSVLCRNHYISPQQFAANVDRIIQKAKAVGVKHFLIISPPPVCEVCKKDKPVRMQGGGVGGHSLECRPGGLWQQQRWWDVSRSWWLWMATHASSSLQSTQQHMI